MKELKDMSEWRTIESAPKGWQQVLTCVKDPRFINNNGHCFDVWVGEKIHEKLSQLKSGMYKEAPHLSYMPTHWQPLPSPPSHKRLENNKREVTLL